MTPHEKALLIMAKVEILKIKCADGGYTWQCHISEADRNSMLETLKEIDEMLGHNLPPGTGKMTIGPVTP